MAWNSAAAVAVAAVGSVVGPAGGDSRRPSASASASASWACPCPWVRPSGDGRRTRTYLVRYCVSAISLYGHMGGLFLIQENIYPCHKVLEILTERRKTTALAWITESI